MLVATVRPGFATVTFSAWYTFRFSVGGDYTIHKHVDFRMIEVGYGSLDTISSATVGGGGDVAVPASNMLTVSSGLVFRF